ncbi:hypothetical protein Rhe02_67600 [Rhizocola hellebori]|uniref:TIR domain-containing protein n=1 Tax=Rhizocola hellebori TaxID=1392758 RepID=A0A8J3QFN2_9ACTN|nr:TIR-like protein FxsC [Rhizocola hellebori]GIH08693.1 hypothetical protein Rhe02_67600 [Rhizocola hellebori]
MAVPNSNTYYFFLSYARDMAGEDVEQLFKDLSKEVCDRAGLPPGSEVGFLDRRSIEWGSSWPRKLVTALSECHTFIALCTPRYFRSEACGKEWWVFEERLKRYEQERGSPNVPVLIPLLWLPTRVMPDRARSRQYDNSRLDPAYQQDGLRQLIRLRQLRDAYIQAISLLAQHIVDQSQTHELPKPTGQMEFHSIPSAFADPDVATAVRAGADAIPATSRYVHFVVAAPSKQEVSQSKIREDLTFYGETRPEWAPYRPKTDPPPADSALYKAIAESARTVASEQSFECGIASIDDLDQRIELAKQNNQLVVFLVDAWATMLTDHRRALVECDSMAAEEHEAPTPAVMVPSSSDDEETRRHWQRLSNELRKVFVNRYAHGDDRMFRTSVLSLDAFEADLRVALKVAQNRMYVLGTPRNDVPDTTGLQPMLDLPESGPDHMG